MVKMEFQINGKSIQVKDAGAGMYTIEVYTKNKLVWQSTANNKQHLVDLLEEVSTNYNK